MKIKGIIIWLVVTIIVIGIGVFKFMESKDNEKKVEDIVIEENTKDIKYKPKEDFIITEDKINDVIEIECLVLSKYNHEDGHVFLNVKNESQELTVPIFDNINYDSSEIESGSIIKVKGKVKKYNGKLEIVPNTNKDIVIIKD